MPRTAHLAIAASLACLFSTPLCAQGSDGSPGPLLSTSEQASLRSKLVKYLEADEAYLQTERGRDRDRANKAKMKAKEDFDKEWDKYSKKGDLVGSIADMKAVFYNCFTVKRPSFSLGQLRKGENKEDGIDYSFWVPKSYKPETPIPTVIALPGGQGGEWGKPQDHFESLFEKGSIAASYIVHVVDLPKGAELDVPPDYNKEGAEQEEGRRIAAVWSGFAETMGQLNVDRARMYLDCSKGNCAFGLRFVTLFPDRFAGLILRDPVSPENVRLGSLSNVPVLIFKTKNNADAVEKLAARLRENAPDSVTLYDATDEYPFKGANGFVEEWMGKHARTMAPAKVIIEPNHDRFNRAYWADMEVVTPLLTAPADQKPRLEVTADRATNRIEVKATGIEDFFLYLNDDLVDLNKEFTVVVNGKAVSETRTRSFRLMLEGLLQRRDWDYLFPVVFKTTVPK